MALFLMGEVSLTTLWMKFYDLAGVRWSMLLSYLIWPFSKKHAGELLFWMAYHDRKKSRSLVYLWRNMLPRKYIKQFARGRAEITVFTLRERQFEEIVE